MRAGYVAIAVASVSWTTSPAVAFLPRAPISSGCTAATSSAPLVNCLHSASSDASEQLPLSPRDETWNPFGVLRELLASPGVPEDAERYDRVGGLSGGTWRSIVVGFLPSTGSKWLVQEEAAGNVYQSFPTTITKILGEKALINLSVQPELHAVGRRRLSQAVSPKAVLELTTTMGNTVDKSIARLESFAESGQEVVLQDELRDFTLESITGVYFGDYATPDLLEDVKQLLPVMTSGLISLPVRFPSPLNKLPVFGFARSMDARETLKSIILSELEKRRAAWACTDGGDRGGKSAGILDSLIEIQRNQMDLEHGRQGTFDDDFIVDNVFLSLFAGTDTTSVTLTRVLQLLATADDGKDIIAKLRQELRNAARSDDDELDDSTGSGSGGASRAGIFASFPLLDAVILEAFRLHPTVPGVFRTARNDVSYNGYLIPAGAMINMNIIHGCRASSLYEEPEKFCPFRFLHGDKSKNGNNAASDTLTGVPSEEPPPPMFGVGRHTCPGRELAKLEILLFLKAFLTKFDYELVGEQSFKGVLPANGPKDKLRVVLRTKSSA